MSSHVNIHRGATAELVMTMQRGARCDVCNARVRMWQACVSDMTSVAEEDARGNDM